CDHAFEQPSEGNIAVSSASEPGRYTLRGVINLLILLLFLLVFVGGSVEVGWVGLFPAWQARFSGLKTQGMVKSLSACDSGGEDVVLPSLGRGQRINNVTPTIQFSDLQNNHTYDVVNSFCGNYAVGELVTLWYAPSHPTSIFVEQDTILWLIFAIIDGISAL